MEFLKLAVLLFMMVFVTAVFHPAALGMLYRSTWRAMRWGLRICAAAFLIG